jgi:GntR family transcriptional repressor for pyruvate dehydrogenase complex
VLQSRSSRGTIVCDRSTISSEILSWALLLGNDDKQELVELRGAIELWSLIRVTSSMKETSGKGDIVIAYLLEEVAIMEQAIANNDQLLLKKADYDFHHQIIKAGDNHLFISLYEILRNFMMNEIEQTHMKYTMQMKIVEEHRELIHAITSGDILQASLTYMTHIENIKSLL